MMFRGCFMTGRMLNMRYFVWLMKEFKIPQFRHRSDEDDGRFLHGDRERPCEAWSSQTMR